MRKLIFGLVSALLATFVLAGCGKFTKCEQAKKPSDCVADKFDGTFKCEWVSEGGSDGNGTCRDK